MDRLMSSPLCECMLAYRYSVTCGILHSDSIIRRGYVATYNLVGKYMFCREKQSIRNDGKFINMRVGKGFEASMN